MFNEDLSFFIICSYDSKETALSANATAYIGGFFAFRLLLTRKGNYMIRCINKGAVLYEPQESFTYS
ncbi:hypothetical protein C7B63_19380 [Bacillus halotolerans]|nr:hypothetical protein B9T64_08450 [Bacillus halotolerans]PRP49170.1 hypothetical protein C7B63_19380 [Bacillus halotolerans]PRP57334.1 hypothetical protein C7B66_19395 [Bacillus halotolerans]PRP63321.1 hypothetical protein C7B72_10630 [Bacillus halotolerans]PSA99749.1 hypothetical protein C6372_03400 [Bacillus halotolerans]